MSKPALRDRQTSQMSGLACEGILNYHLPTLRQDWEIIHRVVFDIITRYASSFKNFTSNAQKIVSMEYQFNTFQLWVSSIFTPVHN